MTVLIIGFLLSSSPIHQRGEEGQEKYDSEAGRGEEFRADPNSDPIYVGGKVQTCFSLFLSLFLHLSSLTHKRDAPHPPIRDLVYWWIDVSIRFGVRKSSTSPLKHDIKISKLNKVVHCHGDKLKFYEPEEEVRENCQGFNCTHVNSTGTIWTLMVF